MLAQLLAFLVAAQPGAAADPQPRYVRSEVEQVARAFVEAVRAGSADVQGPHSFSYQNFYTREHQQIDRAALRSLLDGCQISRSRDMRFDRQGRPIQAFLFVWGCPGRPLREQYMEGVFEVQDGQVSMARVLVWEPHSGVVNVVAPPR